MLRRALISYGARFNSTAAKAPNWTVILPRREEVLKIPKKQEQQLYSPDLSYLKKAPKTSLAGRLFRPTLRTQKGRAKKRVRRLARIQKRDARLSAESTTPGSTTETKEIEHPNIKSNEPPDIDATSQKRIKARLSRERDIERQREMAARGRRFNAMIRSVQDNSDRLHAQGLLLNSPGPLPDDALSSSALKRRQERRLRESRIKFNSPGPLLNSSGSLPFTQSTEKPSGEIPDDELSPSALKRKQERRLRESGSRRNRQSLSLDKEGSSGSGRLNSLTPSLNSPGSLSFTQSAERPSVEIPDDELSPLALKRKQERQSPSLDEKRSSQSGNKSETATHLIDMADLDEAALPTVQIPEFNGPEPISETMDDDFRIVLYHPFAKGHDSVDISESPSYRLNPNLIDSLVGGDYSQYISLSSSISNSTSPKALTVVNTAELALSRQRDHVIPQRKRAIEIVKSLVEGNFVQATKER